MFKNRKCFILLVVMSVLFSCQQKKQEELKNLKVMSFNIWVGGGNSIGATAEVFVNSGADVIGVQESYRDERNTAKHIADSLGWYSYEFNHSTTIVSKYLIADTTSNKYGVKLKLDEKRMIWMLNVHFQYCPYEPYQLNGIKYCGAPFLSTAEQAFTSAWNTRGKEVEEVLADLEEIKKDSLPIFLTGDFNEPSYLDWTQNAAHVGLHKLAVEWPATKALAERGYMKDSYRIIYPDEVKNPGYTWTPLPESKEYKEVLDRIDFVLFSGNNVEVKNSQIIGENSISSDIKFTNYPSDHRAVLSSFILQ